MVRQGRDQIRNSCLRDVPPCGTKAGKTRNKFE